MKRVTFFRTKKKMFINRSNRKKLYISLCVIGLVLILFLMRDYINYDCDAAIIIDKSFVDIPPEMLNENTIFFLETSNSSDHKISSREACAIESAAYMNPNTNIVVLFLTLSNHIRLKNWSQFQPILDYDNIHLRYFHMDDIIKDTPIEKWMQKGLLSRSYYPVVHTSDILRYTLLYKYSGIYLDLDVIVTRPLDEMGSSSFACHQDDKIVNNAIIKLGGSDGKEVGRLLLEEVTENFNGRLWEENGPLLITKSLNKFCKTENLSGIDKCKEFDILSMDKCYAVKWQSWHKLFYEVYADETMEAVKHSYFVHLWNAKSKGTKLETTSRASFNQLAAKHCPRVHQHNSII